MKISLLFLLENVGENNRLIFVKRILVNKTQMWLMFCSIDRVKKSIDAKQKSNISLQHEGVSLLVYLTAIKPDG